MGDYKEKSLYKCAPFCYNNRGYVRSCKNFDGSVRRIP